MQLKILLPFELFAESNNVTSVVVETRAGSFGLLPLRLDCVAALEPGVLVYETAEEGRSYIAIDEGVLVKHGPDVLVCVRAAIRGAELGKMREAVDREFLTVDESEKATRSSLAHLEAGMLRRFAEFRGV